MPVSHLRETLSTASPSCAKRAMLSSTTSSNGLAVGLRWKDLGLIFATLRVSQVLHRLNYGAFVYQELKTAKRRRTIAVSPASCIELRQHRENQERDAGLLGVPLMMIPWCSTTRTDPPVLHQH